MSGDSEFGLKILLVDDNEEIGDVISFYCKNKDIDCTVINDGKQGLDLIRDSSEFDAVLLEFVVGCKNYS